MAREVTFARFQATRQEIENYGAYAGIARMNGRRGYVYANLAPIEEQLDWLEGGVTYDVEGKRYKRLEDAELALFTLWQPIMQAIDDRRHIGTLART